MNHRIFIGFAIGAFVFCFMDLIVGFSLIGGGEVSLIYGLFPAVWCMIGMMAAFLFVVLKQLSDRLDRIEKNNKKSDDSATQS